MDDESAHDSFLSNIATVQITSKIIVIAIIVLFIAVLLVLLLHLYAKLFWWRVEQQQQPRAPQPTRSHRRRFVFVPGQDPLRTGGLDSSLLRALPVVDFRPQDFKDGLECAVCLSELVNGDKARILPKCSHGFHVDCIDMWFQSHSTCPICRDTVAVLDQACSNPNSAGSAADGDAVTVGNHYGHSHHFNSSAGFSVEAPNFPTNILVWGNQSQVTTGHASFEDATSTNVTFSSSSSSSSSANVVSGSSTNSSGVSGVMVIDIHNTANTNENSPSPSIRFVEEEPKSPVTTRLRSLKRLLSREKRVTAGCGGTSASAEA